MGFVPPVKCIERGYWFGCDCYGTTIFGNAFRRCAYTTTHKLYQFRIWTCIHRNWITYRLVQYWFRVSLIGTINKLTNCPLPVEFKRILVHFWWKVMYGNYGQCNQVTAYTTTTTTTAATTTTCTTTIITTTILIWLCYEHKWTILASVYVKCRVVVNM